MSFNTLAFALFFPIVFLVYWALSKRLKCQTMLLLLASWLFYGWWDWRYLLLIVGITATTYFTALLAERSHRRLWTGVNITIGLGVLFLFKYFNFFGDNLLALFSTLGIALDWFTIDVLLPVGVSFYTFQAIAYSVDVYRGEIKAERDPVAFATFIAYFPQLVAGPIERASSLLPQLKAPRRWDYGRAVDGCREALWGLFKKVVVADGLGIYVDSVYGNLWSFWESGAYATIFLGTALFTMQIYCDFSGYCDIGRGVSRCLGIEINQNFTYPFFSTSISDIWRRWNRTLGSWFRDYVFIPLGGSRRGSARTVVNIFIVMLASGLWHGANWMCVLWGVYWGVLGGVDYLINNRLKGKQSTYSGLPVCIGAMIMSFSIFRCSYASDIGISFLTNLAYVLPLIVVLEGIVWLWRRFNRPTRRILSWLAAAAFVAALALAPIEVTMRWAAAVMAVVTIVVEWHNRHCVHGLERMPRSQVVRWLVYVALIVLVVTGYAEATNFIYYQF